MFSVQSQPSPALIPVSGCEFKRLSPVQASCIIKNGNVVTLLSGTSDTSIILRLVNTETNAISEKETKLTISDTCQSVYALGDLILVAGQHHAYLFNAELNLESIIPAAFKPCSIMLWGRDTFIASPEPYKLQLYNYSNPKNPTSLLINTEYTCCGKGTSLFKLADNLFIANSYSNHIGGFESELNIFTLNEFLNEATIQYSDRSKGGHRGDDCFDRRMFGLLPNKQLIEINTGDLFDDIAQDHLGYKKTFRKPYNHISITIRTKEASLEEETKFSKETLSWEIPGITASDEGVLKRISPIPDQPAFTQSIITDCSSRIGIIDYSILFLKKSEIAVYDLQNRIQYNIPLDFRAEGMIVRDNQLFIYNNENLYRYEFSGLRSINSYVSAKILNNASWCPAVLASIIADFVGLDVKLSVHPATVFAPSKTRPAIIKKDDLGLIESSAAPTSIGSSI